jgi:hypothetical protein
VIRYVLFRSSQSQAAILMLLDGAAAIAMRDYAYLSHTQQNQERDNNWKTSCMAELNYIQS